MFLDIKPEQTSKFPKYKGDLELINHSAGSITSETYMKRWNRKNEILADAAEKASVAAELLGARPYPLQRLNDAWTLVMGGQFHDIIPGTATPTAYEFAWNDQILAMNQFAGVLTSATEAVASGPEYPDQRHAGGGLQFAQHRARRRGGSQSQPARRSRLACTSPDPTARTFRRNSPTARCCSWPRSRPSGMPCTMCRPERLHDKSAR